MKSKDEIIEGLRSCSEHEACRNCPYYKESGCVRKLTKDALSLIEHMDSGKPVVPESWKESVMASFMKVE